MTTTGDYTDIDSEYLITDGGIEVSEFRVGENLVTEEDYQNADWIDEYVSDGNFGGHEFHEKFGEGLSSSTEDVAEDNLKVSAMTYCGAVGARAGQYINQSWEEVEPEFNLAVIKSIMDDRGIPGTFWSVLSPRGHGMANPHRRKEDICLHKMLECIESGYEKFNDHGIPEFPE